LPGSAGNLPWGNGWFGSLFVYTVPVFVKPISAEFHWNREAISLGFGLAAICVSRKITRNARFNRPKSGRSWPFAKRVDCTIATNRRAA
jgi:hypothetical protein